MIMITSKLLTPFTSPHNTASAKSKKAIQRHLNLFNREHRRSNYALAIIGTQDEQFIIGIDEKQNSDSEAITRQLASLLPAAYPYAFDLLIANFKDSYIVSETKVNYNKYDETVITKIAEYVVGYIGDHLDKAIPINLLLTTAIKNHITTHSDSLIEQLTVHGKYKKDFTMVFVQLFDPHTIHDIVTDTLTHSLKQIDDFLTQMANKTGLITPYH